MALFSGISDWLTGGRDEQAEQALNDALAAYSNIKAPTQEELSLPQLQQYVEAGIMTPAEAQSYLQNSNAFNTQKIDQTGTAAQVAALNQLAGIANAGDRGTPVEQAQVAQAIQQMNNSVQGQRGAIEQQMEAKGTPAAMIQAALANQYVGQDAQQAYHNSLDAQANAYQTALNAMSQGANVGANLQGQQNAQANTVAAAQNAMQQFNAANQQQASEANAQRRQQANAYNAENAQNVSNQNVGTQNARTAYNTSQRQTSFDDAMRRAQGMADVYGKQASNYQDMGKQSAGTAASIFGGLSNLGGTYMLSNSINNLAGAGGAGGAAGASSAVPAGAEMLPLLAHGGIAGHEGCYHDGGICLEDGGMVPGQAQVPGDSLKNDRVHAMLSPGEAVIPRTVVHEHMPEVLSLIASGRHQTAQPGSAAHPQDIAALLEAMRHLRTGGVHAA